MLKNKFLILSFALLTFNFWGTDIKTESVTYDKENNINGFLAEPVRNGKYPGIIIIHEWWGLNNYIKERAMDFAKLGYVALAVDMYKGKVATNTDDAKVLSAGSRNDITGCLANLSSAIAFLKSQKNVNPDKVASLGFCFGGGWSYNVAKNNLGTKVSVIYYGSIDPKDDLTNMKTIVLGNFGEKDQSIKAETVKDFENVLIKANRKNKIYLYKDAGHAFDNKEGQNYNKEASLLAWKRTIEFLKNNL